MIRQRSSKFWESTTKERESQDHHVLYQTYFAASDRRQKHDGRHNRDFKKRGRGGSKTRLEVTFPIADEEHMLVAFSPVIENAVWRDVVLSGKREYLALLKQNTIINSLSQLFCQLEFKIYCLFKV